MNVLLTCDNCGSVFECKHKERLERKNHFCCKSCEGEYRKKNNPNNKTCPVCGKIFYLKPSHAKRFNKQGNCCSTRCLGILRKELYQGENNPNFGNRGEKNPIWKSDSRISSYGHVLIRMPNHPFANCDGFVFEHRIVAEEYLLNESNSVLVDGKRFLNPKLVVHHKDGNRQNNSPSNLQIMTLSEHTTMHQKLNRLASQNSVKSVKAKGEAHANTENPQ